MSDPHDSPEHPVAGPQAGLTRRGFLGAAAAVGDIDGVRAAVAHHLEVHEQNLRTYRDIDARDFANPDTETDILHHLVLRQGLRTEQMWVDWCREVLSALDRLVARRHRD